MANIINYIRSILKCPRSDKNYIKIDFLFAYIKIILYICSIILKISTIMTNNEHSVDELVNLLKPSFDAVMNQGKITQKEIKTKRKTK